MKPDLPPRKVRISRVTAPYAHFKPEDRGPMKLDSMASSANTRHTVQEEDSSSTNARKQSLQQYLEAGSNSSNDCVWLHALLCSAANSAKQVDPICHVRLHYQDGEDPAAISTTDLISGKFAPSDLESCLDSTDLRAVTLCHRDSSRVDPTVLNLLWTRFTIDVSFMRHHFDYRNFRDEKGCPETIRSRLQEEEELIEEHWTLGGRWNPVRLPSETEASILRLTVDSECLSICHIGDVGKWPLVNGNVLGGIIPDTVITLVRSLGVYRIPLSSRRLVPRHTDLVGCTIDLYNATTNMPSTRHKYLNNPAEFSHSIVHFYARLLILRCYEDYALRHDPQPIDMKEIDRLCIQDHPHIEAMHRRQLEIVRFEHDLKGYLGFSAHEHKTTPSTECPNFAKNSCRQKLQGLLTDVESLLSLYDQSMKIYEWHSREIDSEYRGQLASEQLEEAKESKATAISLGKLSNMAFLYLPFNFVCAMLGMNLAIFGQGTVPTWAFFLLVSIFGLLTYLPILFQRDPTRIRHSRIAYHLAWRSPAAAFWFLAFTFTHSYIQNFEIMNSGLAQVFLGYSGPRTKGWTDRENDSKFETATLGSETFWKKKVKKIFLAVKELDSNNEPAELFI